jgi:aryl-alcohol dehydrogenase-like predicted oxidoreductase
MTSGTFLIGGEWPVHRLGYGAMRLCGQPGNFGPYKDWEAGKRLLRRAVELGVNFIDTAHAYGPGVNEELIADALSPYPAGVLVATKGGVEKTAPDNVFTDGRTEILRQRCEDSLRRLKLERIPLYQLHRPDPDVPFAESVGALAQLRSEGKIAHIGLSNVSLAQVEEARGIVAIAAVQNRYNLAERGDDAVLDYCAAHGIAYLPWGPLAAKPFAPDAPLASDAGLAALAARLQATPGQVALAWLLHRAPNVICIPGTTSLVHLAENVAAASLSLSTDDVAALSAAFSTTPATP